MLKKSRAQSLSDYMILIGIVVAVLVTMFPMVKRSTQSILKAGADLIGSQSNAEQDFTQKQGYTIGVNALVNSDVIIVKQDWPGVMQTSTNEVIDTVTSTYSNLGFTKQEDMQ